jgi:hypothetical protein
MTNPTPAQASVEAVKCPSCDGTGADLYDGTSHDCQVCNGRGTIASPPTVGAEDEASLFHVTGERITRKDLNNAYRSGQENGRLAAHLLDGATAPAADGQRVKVKDWLAVAKAAGQHGVRYRTTRALEAFLSDIRACLAIDKERA